MVIKKERKEKRSITVHSTESGFLVLFACLSKKLFFFFSLFLFCFCFVLFFACGYLFVVIGI